MSSKFIREIVLDGRRIAYTLEYKNIKNVNIHCTPAKGLYISAPYHADLQKLDTYLKEHSKQILAAVDAAKGTSSRVRTQRRTITLGDRTVEYELSFKKIKRINLSVSLDKGVRVSAPLSARITDIEDFLRRSSEFILNAVDKYRKMSEELPKAKTYSEGEYVYFMGEKKQVRLTRAARNFAEVTGGELRIFAKDITDTALKTAIVDAFMKQKCEEIIPVMCGRLYPRFKAKGIEYPSELRFRRMVSCWGNCRPARSIITFSTYLIQLPEKCIEQVICHEFTHFLYQNHSKAFYAQLTEFMPDWKEYEDVIKKLGREIIIR